MPHFSPGDTVYIVANGLTIEEAIVKRFSGGFYTIRFPSGGGIRLRESRLFASKEEAEKSITPKPNKQQFRSPWN